MKKVAVIQSVYKNDKPEYLKLSIDSILNQTFKNFVLFLGIDGPIGNDVREVIESVNDARLCVIENKENKGLASILNDLLAECRKQGYEYIARMDSDDISKPERLEKQIAFLQDHADIDIVGGAINEIDGNGHDRGKVTHYPSSADDCRNFFAFFITIYRI